MQPRHRGRLSASCVRLAPPSPPAPGALSHRARTPAIARRPRRIDPRARRRRRTNQLAHAGASSTRPAARRRRRRRRPRPRSIPRRAPARAPEQRCDRRRGLTRSRPRRGLGGDAAERRGSSPFARPPAINTASRTAAIAASAAWTFVAFELSRNRTPSTSATASPRWAAGSNAAARHGRPRARRRSERGHGGRGVLAMPCAFAVDRAELDRAVGPPVSNVSPSNPTSGPPAAGCPRRTNAARRARHANRRRLRVVAGRAAAMAAAVSRGAPCAQRWFGAGTPAARGPDVGFEGDTLLTRGPVGPVELGSVDGERAGYREDAAAAAAAALAYGVEPDAIAAGIAAFAPAAHRGEVVAEIDGVRFIDNSKATNVHAALAAIAEVRDAVLIAGGRAKGQDLEPRWARAPATCVAVVAMGEASGRDRRRCSAGSSRSRRRARSRTPSGRVRAADPSGRRAARARRARAGISSRPTSSAETGSPRPRADWRRGAAHG